MKFTYFNLKLKRWSYYWKIIYFTWVVKTNGMFFYITKVRIWKGHASSRGYPFMFTNPIYEMSLSFTHIRRLTLTSRIFINNIGQHHKWIWSLKEKKEPTLFLLTKMHLKLTWRTASSMKLSWFSDLFSYVNLILGCWEFRNKGMSQL